MTREGMVRLAGESRSKPTYVVRLAIMTLDGLHRRSKWRSVWRISC